MSCNCYSSVLVYDIMEFLLDQQLDLSKRMHKIDDNKNNKEFSNLAVQTETATTAEPTSGVNKTAKQGQVE